jgi:hypothetical protein
MSYAAALVLVGIAVLGLLGGIAMQSIPAFVIAILASATAVGLLAKKGRSRRVKTFVNDAPPRVDPKWSLDVDVERTVRDEQLPVALEIDHIINGYADLVAAEVLPSLETLSADELRKVIYVERHGRNRQAIIHRAEVLIDLTEGREITIDPDAPARKRRVNAAKSKSKQFERDERQSLKRRGPSLGL